MIGAFGQHFGHPSPTATSDSQEVGGVWAMRGPSSARGPANGLMDYCSEVLGAVAHFAWC